MAILRLLDRALALFREEVDVAGRVDDRGVAPTIDDSYLTRATTSCPRWTLSTAVGIDAVSGDAHLKVRVVLAGPLALTLRPSVVISS